MAKVDMSRNDEKLTKEVDTKVRNNTIRKVVMIGSENLINEVIQKIVLKIKGTLIANVCKVTIIKIEDFDEVMLIVQV